MSEDFHEDIAVKLTDVLRHLHNFPYFRGLDDLIETVCAEHGVEIDWAAAPDEPRGD